MTEMQIAGTIESALSHMALVGLAAIVDDCTGTRPRIRWTEDWPSRATLTCGLTTAEIAEAVRSHAQGHTEPGDWMTQRVVSGPRDGSGLFTPRAKGMTDPADWRAYLDQRRATLVTQRRLEAGAPQASRTTASEGGPPAALRPLDEAMLVGMGETAWWLAGSKRRRPDDGASRWEMKTRNRGEEFIRDRLCHLAANVAARTLTRVSDGLTGLRSIDEAGKDAPDSRSSTGLTTPGPTDNAIAWCALWGIAAAPTLPTSDWDPDSRGMSQTPGTWPRDRVHPTHFGVPVFTRPATVGRWSAVLVSRPFDLAMRGLASGLPDVEAQSWLREQGVRALACFPSRVVGSASAPERQLLTGQAHPM